jgi:putative phosphoribosyl transferase
MNRQVIRSGNEKDIVISTDDKQLKALFGIIPNAKGLVIFAHGSGSGRFSPRNNYVARVLQSAGHATLLADLLDEAEAADRQKIFDIDLLADRLLAISRWASAQPDTNTLKQGYFGASTGAAAALQAAARDPQLIKAILSRGGRPDLALYYLPLVQAPTLLIVGGNDRTVISLNESAYAEMLSPKKMVIVPGASHLFEEPGTLEEVARLASEWFTKHFAS